MSRAHAASTERSDRIQLRCSSDSGAVQKKGPRKLGPFSFLATGRPPCPPNPGPGHCRPFAWTGVFGRSAEESITLQCTRLARRVTRFSEGAPLAWLSRWPMLAGDSSRHSTLGATESVLSWFPPRGLCKRSVSGPAQAAARVASSGCQFQGKSSAMRRAGWSAMRASTSAR